MPAERDEMIELSEDRPPYPVESISVPVDDSRSIAVWRSGGADRIGDRKIALVTPGFARRMRNMVVPAMYLAANGFTVYRCDYVDHIGTSDGDIWNFTMSGMRDSIRALHDYVRTAEGDCDTVIVGASLSMRAAYRLAAENGGISGIVGIVGVVDTAYTFERVFNEDITKRIVEDVDPHDYVTFEKNRIGCLPFLHDWYEQDWVGLSGTIKDVERLDCGLVNFCGTADTWIDVRDVRQVFDAARKGGRVVELPFVEHELSSNPVAAQTLLREATLAVMEMAGRVSREDGNFAADFVEPEFGDIASQIPYERRLAMAEIASATF
ncbi:hypothetical protein HLB23_38360 [Nocardia uniformis]|uniref:Acyl transferase n=1 Tax=Nocardia uniformis TaxID=53432 RepID=A0A849CAU5_9NOCA|nr:hypothetical protein [Nocardia uniformis]NNH75652.1 hypothetical protein [Nocardia uniformis]